MNRIAGLLSAVALFTAAPALAQEPGAQSPVLAEPAPTAPAAPVAPVAPVAAPALAHFNAGFGNEAFYLRSDDDNFVLIPSGRLQLDFFAPQGGSRQPFASFLPKRARVELFGTILKHWDFQIGTELTGAAAVASDIWLNANYSHYANVQVGQFDAPFTMENRTSDKWFDMQERSVVVRAFAMPENKELGAMVWGQPDKKWAYWSLGVFNGEGQNQAQKDNNFDVMGRAWIAPLGAAGVDMFKNVWVGGSYWTGNRNPSVSGQLDRPAMKTQAGFTFFNPVAGAVHTGYFGQTNKWGLELNAPLGPVVVKAEYVSLSEGLREVNGATAVRNATLSGGGFYGRVSYFFWGDPLINGLGGMQTPNRLFGELKPGKTQDALQLVLEYDRLAFNYSAEDGADATADSFVGDYGFSTIGVGLNYWYTKHIRLTGNFLYNFFDGPGPRPLLTSDNSYEFTFRVALAL